MHRNIATVPLEAIISRWATSADWILGTFGNVSKRISSECVGATDVEFLRGLE